VTVFSGTPFLRAVRETFRVQTAYRFFLHAPAFFRLTVLIKRTIDFVTTDFRARPQDLIRGAGFFFSRRLPIAVMGPPRVLSKK
jgi:hypothetical protein